MATQSRTALNDMLCQGETVEHEGRNRLRPRLHEGIEELYGRPQGPAAAFRPVPAAILIL
jgi:hypothetical protein